MGKQAIYCVVPVLFCGVCVPVGFSAWSVRHCQRPGAPTCCPHVDAERILCTAQQDLRRAVPARGNVVRQDRVVIVGYVELRHAARKPKVGQLDQAVRVEQQIGRLDVSVQQTARVHELRQGCMPAQAAS
eukprot:249054-Chlamydomonas_euryale.AAC.10